MSEPRWSLLLRRLEHRATPVVALLLIGLVFFLGIRSERTGFVDEVLDPNLKRITHPVLNAFRGKPPAVTALTVQLGESEQDSLAVLQDLALTSGWVDEKDNAWLPVKATLDGSATKAFLQLKGGPVDRGLVPRWPLVIGLQQADTTQDVQYFDLFPVHDARPIHGSLLRIALEDLGLPVLSQEIVELRLNGRDLGLYTLEGRPGRTRLAHWGRGNGPVLRFDDVLHEHAKRSTSDLLFPIDAPLGAEWLSAPILIPCAPQHHTPLHAGPADRKALEALESFRSGAATPSEVFDAGSLGKFMALCDVLGAQESAQWWNLYFLADTITGKLLVLPRRAIAGKPISGIIARHTHAPITFPSHSSSLAGRFLGDRVVYTAYITWLDRLGAGTWLDEFLERNAEPLELLERIVRSEYPDAELDRAVLEHCRSVVDLMLHPREPVLVYTRSVRSKQRTLAVANVHDLPIVVIGMVNSTDTVPFGIPVVVPPREENKPLAYTRIDVEVPEDHGPSVTLVVTLLGSSNAQFITSRTSGMYIATQ